MKVDRSQLPSGSPAAMMLHIQKTKHSDYDILQGKKNKIRGIYCKTCKKFITPIVLVR